MIELAAGHARLRIMCSAVIVFIVEIPPGWFAGTWTTQACTSKLVRSTQSWGRKLSPRGAVCPRRMCLCRCCRVWNCYTNLKKFMLVLLVFFRLYNMKIWHANECIDTDTRMHDNDSDFRLLHICEVIHVTAISMFWSRFWTEISHCRYADKMLAKYSNND